MSAQQGLRIVRALRVGAPWGQAAAAGDKIRTLLPDGPINGR